MSAQRLRTVALLARQPGLRVLEDVLLGHPELEITAVFTHDRLPRAEGGGSRPEVGRFRSLCESAGVAMHSLDLPEAKDISSLLPAGPLDLLVSLSWRYLVPQHVLDRFTRGCINVHRGTLPAYAGAHPVQRAIEAGERRVAITVHEMIAEVDAGDKIAEIWIDVEPVQKLQDAAVRAEVIKSVMEPLYAPLVGLALRSRLVTVV